MWDDILVIAGVLAAVFQALTAAITLASAIRGRVNPGQDAAGTE